MLSTNNNVAFKGDLYNSKTKQSLPTTEDQDVQIIANLNSKMDQMQLTKDKDRLCYTNSKGQQVTVLPLNNLDAKTPEAELVINTGDDRLSIITPVYGYQSPFFIEVANIVQKLEEKVKSLLFPKTETGAGVTTAKKEPPKTDVSGFLS